MRAVRLWVLVLVAAFSLPALVLAQEYKTINKPGVMLSNVQTDDEKGKPMKVKKGEKVTVIYNRDDWMWVKTKGGRSGWVLKKEVKVQEGDAVAAAPAEDGKKKEDEKAKKEDEKAAKQAAADEAKKKKEDEKAAKLAAAEEAKKQKEDEKAAKLAAAEEAKKQKEDEKAAKLAAAEEAKKQKEPVAAAVPAPAPQPVAAPEPAPAPAPVVAVVEKAPPPAPVLSPGYITVLASEPGAAVLLDGRRVGAVPLKRLAVDGGRHQVTVMKEEFNPSWQEVEVNGNEVPVNLALAPSPAYLDSHKMAVWRNRGLGVGAVVAGGALAAVAAAAGVGGALLWVAANTMFLSSPKKGDYLSLGLALSGAAVAFVSPLLALAAGTAGAAGGVALAMLAGDPSRYAAYGE